MLLNSSKFYPKIMNSIKYDLASCYDTYDFSQFDNDERIPDYELNSLQKV